MMRRIRFLLAVLGGVSGLFDAFQPPRTRR